MQSGTVGTVMLMAVVAAVVSLIFFGISQKNIASLRNKLQPLSSLDPKIQHDVSRIEQELKATCDSLNSLEKDLPHTNEVNTIQENMQRLCTDFTELRANIEDQMKKFTLNTTEDLNKTKDDMISNVTTEIASYAKNQINQNSITKEEFQSLKEWIERMIGADETADRMEVLQSMFDSAQIKTLNWQCKLIKLLIGGLAPDAEEDLIISSGIPKSSSEKFLKKLIDAGIVEAKDVPMFYIVPDYEWLHSYVENPDWLQKRLDATVKKEKDYQEYIRNNLHLIEDGLLLEHSEYGLATGKIDFVCRDASGLAVGLELKYPSASTGVKRQIMGYKNDYAQKTGMADSRFIVVAPHIPEKLKGLLKEDGIEYREIDF